MLSKLIVSCGGTGGHYYPGLSIARKAQDKGLDVSLFLTGRRAPGQAEIAEEHGLKSNLARALSLPSIKKPWRIPLFAWRFYCDYLKAKKFLREEKPDAVLFMGSFAGVPLGLACASLKIPTFIHEGNVWAGKANRFMSKYAQKFLASFPLKNESAIQCPTVVVGMPIRPELLEENFKKPDFISHLNDEDPLVLCFGGSQGAEAINKMLRYAYDVMNARKYKLQLVQLTGSDDNAELIDFYGNSPVAVSKQSQEMGALINRANVVVCRAGASSIAELIHFKTKAVLIPYPIAAEDHQEINADYACQSNGFYKLHQSEIDQFSLANAIELQMRQDKELDFSMIDYPDAADKVLKEIFPKI
ncbi:UDP-N-acetylglucosamine--N-acetylmuramyl- (pentapeptide) pyrophosphoryl-undecaprenol N-acetylglucosamine [Lentisphaera araneosa HTCC2155]|uniref:UDP-N-acetylglucosamine--N-acetylmuramyl-(pentapeptide) pyrophosphoryl-undecaprenol N-acetylglucosamine transferase n=1 Tax=Lentisphaera araneosa HTCC2155 TaxID=313628 RepID=A6DIQ0_9BACT|nr:UDP-N-acetylglucosamine--N-acetylmuramyl-(pentapeptide) pyrophosphoryl-undecaprenol N-acetylglucosamine transferase [Lentisphaera araneosa]EDM28336.1 UDP-N-acetylglucosamine--N-acetylmuramyl- (pentapeptide) pyrophosphoryl-undecaprenol N-acetylglucosamine [Lentisphaera araneosa HTCC2155]